MRSNPHGLDWPNQPLPFKIYTSLEPLPLSTEFSSSTISPLSALAGECAGADASVDLATLARVCYFSNGITRTLRGMPFRAAACTGALYHIELYVVCGGLADLDPGVYHYAAHDNALRRLRSGDYRSILHSATAGEPSVTEAPATLVLTSTWWRNAWKYQARAYRHAFWDSGTILANLLAVACANGLQAHVIAGFADVEVSRLLDIPPSQEGALCLVPLGAGATASPDAPAVEPLQLPTQRLSPRQVEYTAIVDAHLASSLATADDVAAWRSGATDSRPPSPPQPVSAVATAVVADDAPSIEHVILRRGSSRRFTHDPVTLAQLQTMLEVATTPLPVDAHALSTPYLIVNAVEGVQSGTYAFDRSARHLELLRAGEFRREAAYLDLGQELAGDAAFDVYWLVDLADVFTRLGERGYRVAQLEAAIEAGKLYLAAYALGLGATGLTFFDDDVTRFFSPHATGKSVMFLTAVGHPARRRLS